MVEHEDGVLQRSVLALNLFDLFIQIAALLLELLLLLRTLFDKNTHGRESRDSVNKRDIARLKQTCADATWRPENSSPW